VDFISNKRIWILTGAVIVAGVATFAYREHLRSDAHWITKILCDDMPVFTGGYKRCLEHYAPAGADRPSAGAGPS
jgi:hypothetical protein